VSASSLVALALAVAVATMGANVGYDLAPIILEVLWR
jgi:hypothetical protein